MKRGAEKRKKDFKGMRERMMRHVVGLRKTGGGEIEGGSLKKRAHQTRSAWMPLLKRRGRKKGGLVGARELEP